MIGLRFSMVSSDHSVILDCCHISLKPASFRSVTFASPSSRCCTRFISEVFPAPHGALIPIVSGGTVFLLVIKSARVRAYASYPRQSFTHHKSESTIGVGAAFVSEMGLAC